MGKLDPTHKYDDIIALPRHRSAKRAPMSLTDRAAQFSPFAALTGYEAVIAESGRLTQREKSLTEEKIEELNRTLQQLQERIDEHPGVSVTWFCPDSKKAGGAYLQTTGRVKKLDTYTGTLLLTDNTAIPICTITALRIC